MMYSCVHAHVVFLSVMEDSEKTRNMNGLKPFMEEMLLSLHLQIVWKIYRSVKSWKMIFRIWGYSVQALEESFKQLLGLKL